MAEFSNPNQQGGQDNRSLVAMMVVMVAVLFGAQYYHSKTTSQPPSAPTTAAPQALAPQNSTAAAAAINAPMAAVPAATAAPSVPVVQAGAETTTVVENELYRITFSNRGGQVTSWVLKQYPDDQGKPLDVVHQQAAKVLGYPMSLYTYDGSNVSIGSASRNNGVVSVTTQGNVPAGLNGRAVSINGIADSTFNGTYVVTQTGPNTLTYSQGLGENGSSSGGTIFTVNGSTGEALSQALFVPSATGLLSSPGTLTFKYSNGDVQATKTFSFDESYVLHADVQVRRSGAPIRALLSWPGGFGDQNENPNMTAYTNGQFDSAHNGSDEHLATKKVSGGETLNGPYDWVGVSDPFFAAVFLPDSPATSTVATLHRDLDVAKTIKRVGFNSGSAPTKVLNLPVLGAAIGDTGGETSTKVFVGPKAVNVLKSVHAADNKVTLEPLLEFGFWGWIGKGLFFSLYWISHLVSHWSGQWGWAIIGLTIVINILTIPFKIKTMQSALKMQRIQPQMDAIKERYKKYKVTDPKRNEMNSEIMDLQKKEGVNMFGGCIPPLITMPLFMAFFTMLPRVVELRHAHWMWLPNLQAPDPLHILPILTIVTQFLVQYYTPSPGVDPQQQRMMAFMMPAFFGYMTWNYASGLALYWAIGNLIGIGQQAIMNRTSLGREMREIAAKRARRKAGNGGTIQARR
ncbi:MAG: membrane protein insertase YidC [Acidobacteriota bacterium]|nr:membrane protein insertase YidC [Acidobacteriota bacterium]